MKNERKISLIAPILLVLSFTALVLAGGFFVCSDASAADAALDTDGDGLSDADEAAVYFTDPSTK